MNPQLIRFTRSVLSLVYLILIILSIPLAFDVGGIDCGLTFSFTICVLYFVLATARSLTRKNKYLRWVSVFYYFQYIAIPSILTLFLSYYSGKTKPRKFYVVELWTIFIVNSTPIFTILEGFCSLLSIQAIGQTVSWLTAYKSDSWLIVSLIASGSTITGGLYFLYRIYVLPITIDLVGSSLLGSLLTLTFGLGLFGIVSGKGSIIESSLLFAYIVRCIYETFPQLRDNANQAITDIFTNTRLLVEIPMLSPHLSNTISTILPFLAANVPASFRTMYEFLNVSITKLPIPVLFNFSYRITSFFAATKIIPALYHSTLYPSASPPRTPSLVRSRETSTASITSMSLSRSESNNSQASIHSTRNMRQQFSSDKPPSTIVRLIYSYSPCIIIPVYTHLLMSYHGELATHLKFWDVFGSGGSSIVQLPIHPVKFWNWVNMGTTLLLYLLELMGSNNHIDGNNALTNHWKVD
ncbi:ICE2-domain-containing protein [Yamadazyma tenuis ATCC 10573]|uniref:ICE2-domain-containing protein n=1 Tax=Candida tenuis (strain ATCC 10573 / BCRC 21748 / CBS 615 / JCM 9827 / NBRC 10315 / NRRL Y-1498 / VKM Y-70) TaxID=590646 RepID=G3BFQ6_CANTC|nr:ICE2-domain-containing protein [Yamadazyma tenuis ATCC 10573]EGV60710.1 ICE2-domain-containing protein [Yamadazyma tenuis ATCC 10573]